MSCDARDSFNSVVLARTVLPTLVASLMVLLVAGSCNGQTTITLTFENASGGPGLLDQEQVLNYYNGGLGSDGSGPGPNYGITFGAGAIATIAMSAGGSGDFSGNPSGVPIIVTFLSGPGVVMNVPGGFTTGFSFYYTSGPNTGVVTVYDGPNGTGNLLATVPLAATGTPCSGSAYYYSCWSPQGVAFPGVAQSVDFSGATNMIGFDNITLGSQTPTYGNPPPSESGPILSVTPSVSASTTTLSPGVLTQTVVVTNTGAAGSFTASVTPQPFCPAPGACVAGFTICPQGETSCAQPTGGTIGGSGSTVNLSVSYNTTGQPPGIYTGTYTVTPVDNDFRTAGAVRMAKNIAPRTGTPAPEQSTFTGQSTGTYTVMINGVLVTAPASLPYQGLAFNLTESQPQQSQTFVVGEATNYPLPVIAKYYPPATGPAPSISGPITGAICPVPSSGIPYSGVCTPENIEVIAAQGNLPAGGTSIGKLTLTCLTNIPCVPLSVPLVVTAPAVSASNTTSVLPDFAVGDGFVTDFYVVNTGSSAANFSITFYNSTGSPVVLPFANGVGNQSTLSGSLPAGGAAFYEAGTPQGASLSGSAVITSGPGITIQALFRREVNGIYYEAAVPSSGGSSQIAVPFDNTIFSGNGDQIYTGLAIANLSASAASTVSCTARNSQGNVIQGAIPAQSLSPLGQWSAFQFPALAGLRGTIDCISNTEIGAIGIRGLGTNAISSLPVISLPVTSSGGTSVLPDFAVGDGFVTDFYMVNTGGSAANFSITFYDSNGSPVALPFANGVGNQSTLSGSIPAGGAAFYEAGTPQGAPLSGSAVITAGLGITIQALFRREVNGIYYEAAVPASSGSTQIEVPFDDTTFSGNGDQLYTGLAIANLDTSNSAAVSCTAMNSAGAVIQNAGITVPTLNPLGQWSAYTFSGLVGLRGTIDCTSNTQIGAIGIRALGTNALSSLPIIVP
jgi:hypothetical protein